MARRTSIEGFASLTLEKKLKKLDGVQALNVQMEEGQVQMKLKEGATVTEEQISEAVADAGFTVLASSMVAKMPTSYTISASSVRERPSARRSGTIPRARKTSTGSSPASQTGCT